MRFLVILFVFFLGSCDTALTFLAGEDWQNPGGKTFAQIHWTGSGADATAKITIVARNQAEW
ncbi:MAG: hypothetical protein AB7G06_05020, partial [Bdellovibrionales bacterium]